MKVGATSNTDLKRICEAGGRRGEIYSKLQSIASTYGDLVRQRFPNIPRRVSGYATSTTFCRRTGSTSPVHSSDPRVRA